MGGERSWGPRVQYKNDTVGVLLILITITLALSPLFIACLILFLSMDSWYFILEDVLPSPYERSIKVILLSWLLRAVLAFSLAAEAFRWASIVAIILVVTGYSFVSTLGKLYKMNSSLCCLLLYVRFRLIYVCTQYVIRMPISLATAGLHFGTVLLYWLVIRCSDYMPFSLLLVFCALSVSATVFSWLLLPTVAKLSIGCRQLIKRRLIKHRRRNRYYYYLWKAQMRVEVPCGIFFNFGPLVVIKYLNWVINNLATSIILVDPQGVVRNF